MSRTRWFIYSVPCLLVICLSILFLTAGGGLNVQGATIIADQGGNGDFLTIQDAVDNAADGDTIRIWNGTYTENVVVNRTLTIIGNTTSNVTIDGDQDAPVVNITAGHVNITGLKIVSSSTNSDIGIVVINTTQASITRVNFTNLETGIQIYNSSHTSISWINISGIDDGIYLQKSNYTDITDVNLTNLDNGIKIYDTSNCNITRVNLTDMQDGIYLWNSTSCNLTGISTNDITYAIQFVKSSQSTVYNSLFYNIHAGVTFQESNNITVTSNNVSLVGNSAFIAYYSDYISIINNEAYDIEQTDVAFIWATHVTLSGNSFQRGIVWEMEQELMQWNTHNVDGTNLVGGKPLLYLSDQVGGIIPPGLGQIVLVNCSQMIIEDQSINNTHISIQIAFSSNIDIWNNTLFNNSHGLYLFHSSYIFIYNNEIASLDGGAVVMEYVDYSGIYQNNLNDNDFGIYMLFSEYNVISGNTLNNIPGGCIGMELSPYNTVTDNEMLNVSAGIGIGDSGGSVFTGNVMVGGGFDIYGTTLWDWNSLVLDTSNTVDGKYIRYVVDQIGGSVPIADTAQIILVNCTGVNVTGHSISDRHDAVDVAYSFGINIFGNNLTGNTRGVNFYETRNSMVFSNNLSSNDYGAVQLGHSPDNEVSNNNVSSSTGTMFSVECSENTVLESNWAVHGDNNDIRVTWSNNTVIHNNTLLGKSMIKIDRTHWAVMTNNTLVKGIVWVSDSPNTWVEGNYFNDSQEAGVSVQDSPNSSFIGNIINNASVRGLAFYDSPDCLVKDNYLYDNGWQAIALGEGSDRATLLNNTVISSGLGGISMWSDGHTLIENTITGSSSQGILLSESNDITLTNNQVTLNGEAGVEVKMSENIVISGGTFSSNGMQGIDVWSSSHVMISDVTITFNTYQGITIDDSPYVSIINNDISNNLDEGLRIYTTDNSTISGNMFDSNTDMGLFVDDINDTEISGNTITGSTFEGLRLQGSLRNTISNNEIISNARYGIWVGGHTKWNIYVGNIIEDNAWDGYFNSGGVATDNTFYHNTFINNDAGGGGVQAYDNSANSWDNGYPQGGNYWHDYAGVDVFSGPNQDKNGSDGLGDTTWALGGTAGNSDNYPLYAIPGNYSDVVVMLLTPEDGDVVYGKVHVSALTVPEKDTFIIFYVNGIQHSMDDTYPFETIVDTTNYPDAVPLTIEARGSLSDATDEVTVIPINNVASGDYIRAQTVLLEYHPEQFASVLVDIQNDPPMFDSLKLWVRCTDPSGNVLHNEYSVYPDDNQYRVLLHLPTDAVLGGYSVSVEAIASYMAYATWNATAYATFTVTGSDVRSTLEGLEDYLYNLDANLSDVMDGLEDVLDATDELNLTIKAISISLASTNASLAQILSDLGLSLDDVNASLANTISSLEGNFLGELAGVNSSLAGKIQNALADITDEIGGLNDTLMAQLLLLATSGDVDDLQAWMDSVMGALDSELASAELALANQITGLEVATATHYNDIVSDLSETLLELYTLRDSLDGHDRGLDDSIAGLEDLMADIGSTTMTEVRSRLTDISGNISQYSQALGDDLSATAANVADFEAEMEARLTDLNDTLTQLDKLQSILDEMDALANELEQAESELKGDIEGSGAENSDQSQTIMLLLFLVVVLTIISLLMGMMALKGGKMDTALIEERKDIEEPTDTEQAKGIEQANDDEKAVDIEDIDDIEQNKMV